MTPLVLIQEDVEYGLDGEGGVVPDGLYPRGGPPSLRACVRLRPQAQLRSLHDLGVPPQRHPEETHQVPWAEHVDPSPSPDHPDKRGRTFCGSLTGDNKTKGAGGKE